MITATIVTYKNDFEILSKAIYSFLSTPLNVKLYIVDNSPTDKIRNLCYDRRIIYRHNKRNIGFGKAHNQILKEIVQESKYHLVMNPDVYFKSNIVGELAEYMDSHRDTGLVMPKILNPNGTIQYNCKLLPTPNNLIVRRFLSFYPALVENSNFRYEMQFSDYNKMMEVPFLSGCFMFLNVEAIRKVGFFDERFFLYGEDIDYSRRIHQQFKTIYYPKVSIYHYHAKGSYKSLRLMFYNIISAIKYFNKWGWWDEERKVINQRIVAQIGKI